MFDGERFFASLGNRSWGALAAPLGRFKEAGGEAVYYSFTQSAIEYIHIVDPGGKSFRMPRADLIRTVWS